MLETLTLSLALSLGPALPGGVAANPGNIIAPPHVLAAFEAARAD